jgi:sterol desaturase/sphingolipid hydroxylase (fatty acid hydroxylase superfamily)
MIHQVFDIYGFVILTSVLVVLFVLESIFKLRRRIQSRFKRIVTNTILALPAFALLRLMLIPAMVWLAYKNESWHFALNYLYNLPTWLENIIAFILLDYAIYWWHIILHRMPLMWRFHLVHHTDLDLDVTTAFRFHFGEMFSSLVYRGAVVLLIGASPLMVLIYEIIFEVETQFHHSNTKLPIRFERILNKIIVTPRMHGIHHSIIKHETDSNYATIFSFWDRLHKTIRLNIHQDDVIIGVPVYHDEKELTIGKLLKLPFTSIREWKDAEKITDNKFNELKK